MRRATAYRRPEGIYVHSESETTSGVWVATRPFSRLSIDASVEHVGQAIIEALAESQTAMPHPEDWSAVEYPLPALAGLKLWSTFMKSAICVNISAEDGRIEIRPSKNLGPTKGYEPLDEIITICQSDNVSTLGETLMKTFSLCM